MKDLKEGELSVHALKEGYIQRAGSPIKGTRIELCFWYGRFRVQVIERSRIYGDKVIEEQTLFPVKKARATFREMAERFEEDIIHPKAPTHAVRI